MAALERLIALDAARRLAAQDPTLFAHDPVIQEAVSRRLGWVGLASDAPALIPSLTALADELRAEGTTDFLLLGMGGSSLAALVMAQVIGSAPGYPRLHVLDTTSPTRVSRLLDDLDPATTLVVVSSKSGTTVEPNALLAIVGSWLAAAGERVPDPGRRCIVITDPGSALELLARDTHARATLLAPSSVGGRYSALSVFGLAPAALIGVDIERLVERAVSMERVCQEPGADNPAVRLAAWIADAWSKGCDKLTVVCSERLRPFGLWLAQLVAESIGKQGRGVVPVLESGAPEAARYAADRAVLVLREANDEPLARWSRDIALTHPVHTHVMDDVYDLGAEFVRWEYATALLGVLAGVNPFDEPDVTAAKKATAAIIGGQTAAIPQSAWDAGGTAVTFAGGLEAPAGSPATRQAALGAALAAALDIAATSGQSVAEPAPYVALLAYSQDDDRTLAALGEACARVSETTGLAVCLEAGPRYLHSTGQLHKGGPDTGVFIMITGRDKADLAVPGSTFTLRALNRAQAEGDLVSLSRLGRYILRLDLPTTDDAAMAALATELVAASESARRK